MRMLFLIGLAAAWGAAPDVMAEVRRCVTPEGQVVYTDRRCEVLGAAEQPIQPGRPAAATYRGGCARTLRDLVYEVGEAIAANDTNRLAAFYHWTGMSTRHAYSVVARLDAISRRPLVDIVPVMPGDPAQYDYAQSMVRRPPVALRIEQTLANGVTPARAVFGLQRHLGCWWLRG